LRSFLFLFCWSSVFFCHLFGFLFFDPKVKFTIRQNIDKPCSSRVYFFQNQIYLGFIEGVANFTHEPSEFRYSDTAVHIVVEQFQCFNQLFKRVWLLHFFFNYLQYVSLPVSALAMRIVFYHVVLQFFLSGVKIAPSENRSQS